MQRRAPVGPAVGGIGGTTAGPSNFGNKDDYIPHHEPFQYYASTANPHHLAPASVSAIGTDTQASSTASRSSTPPTTSTTPATSTPSWRAISHGFVSPTTCRP